MQTSRVLTIGAVMELGHTNFAPFGGSDMVFIRRVIRYLEEGWQVVPESLAEILTRVPPESDEEAKFIRAFLETHADRLNELRATITNSPRGCSLSTFVDNIMALEAS